MSSYDNISNSLMLKFYKALAAGNPAMNILPDSCYYISFIEGGIFVDDKEIFFDPYSFNAEDIAAAAAFADLTSTIPSYNDIWRDKGTRLWDVYQRVLSESILPLTLLKPNEQKKLDSAISLLWTKPNIETELYKIYQEHSAKFNSCVDSYNSLMQHVKANPDDISLNASWRTLEPMYKKEIDIEMKNWISAGKYIVEDAISTIDFLTKKSPYTLWKQYLDEFNSFKRTGLDGGDYWIAEPLSFGTAINWIQMSFSSQEKDNSDDYNLKNYFSGASTLNLDSFLGEEYILNLEFCRIPIKRPWFDPKLLTNRAWKFLNELDLLSDGNLPPKGDCVLIPIEIILAQNIFIDFISVEKKMEFLNKNLSKLGFFRIKGGSLLSEIKPQTLKHIEITRKKPWYNPKNDPSVDPSNPDLESFHKHNSNPFMSAEFTTTPLTHVPIILPQTLRSQKSTIAFKKESTLSSLKSYNSYTSKHLFENADIDYNNKDITDSILHLPQKQLIGLGCHLLPRCPNPDSSLVWP